ncbi:MAG: helix-turn-helix domain-containing protein [Patescibacteria group bacterium]
MLEERLGQIGLKSREVKIYLELLKIGPQAVSILAKRVGLNRTTAYSVLRCLERKGLVSNFNSNNIKFFSANDPNCLIGFVDEKCKTYDYYREELIKTIPQFRELMSSYSFKQPIVSHYEGPEGVKFLMYDALKSNNCYTYFAVHKWRQSGLREFLLQYIDLCILNNKVPLKTLTPDTPEVRAFFNDYYDSSNMLNKFMFVADPGHLPLFENHMIIFDDKVIILHLDRGEEYGILIESKETAQMHRAAFEITWKALENKYN